MSSPIGELFLVSTDSSLLAVCFEKNWRQYRQHFSGIELRQNSILKMAEKQLNEYFKGRRTDFDLPLELQGTAFQVKAWMTLCQIPFGKTISYQEQAVKMKSPNAVRAIGRANGQNHLPIIIPCHRVIGKNGKLTGYSGGLSKKQTLLAHENQ